MKEEEKGKKTHKIFYLCLSYPINRQSSLDNNNPGQLIYHRAFVT